MQGSLWAVNPRFSNQLFRRGIFRAVGGMHKSGRPKLYTLHKFRPPSPPWLHKTPGGEKGKKDNRLTPQPPSAAAPLCKGSDGGLLSFYPFLLPGPCLGTPHNAGKAARYVTGRLTLSNCQREVSHCQRTQSAGKNSSVGKLICEKMEQGSSWQLPPGQSLSGMQ